MKKVVIIFLILYIIMFLIDYFELKKFMTSEYEFMRYKYNLPKKNKKFIQSIKLKCSVINAFILSIVSIFALFIKLPLYIILFSSFILLLLLIYCFYSIYGRILLKKLRKNKC